MLERILGTSLQTEWRWQSSRLSREFEQYLIRRTRLNTDENVYGGAAITWAAEAQFCCVVYGGSRIMALSVATQRGHMAGQLQKSSE